MLAWFLIALLAVALLAALTPGHKSPEHLNVPPVVVALPERHELGPETHTEISVEPRAVRSASSGPSYGTTASPGVGQLTLTGFAPDVIVAPAHA